MLITLPRTDRWLVDITDAMDVSACGGKAARLARLQRAGLAIPPAICLTTEFYRRWLDGSGLEPRIALLTESPRAAGGRTDVLRELRAEIAASPLPHELDLALRAGIVRLEADGAEAFAVRSSGVHEDDREAAHAGIHASVVVAGRDRRAVAAAVKTCWTSLWTEAAWTYRERLGISHEAVAMAVVIQRFVAAV